MRILTVLRRFVDWLREPKKCITPDFAGISIPSGRCRTRTPSESAERAVRPALFIWSAAVNVPAQAGDTAHCQANLLVLTTWVPHPASWTAEEVATLSFKKTLVTIRLEVRPPCEADRVRFIELFGSDAFMIFSSQALTEEAASKRFDHMLAMCEIIPFSKQAIVERSSGIVVGYTGVDYFTFEGEERLEWGYRLVPELRGFGYATEASQALLAHARETFSGELLAIIDPANHSFQKVCRKLGFAFLKQAHVDGDVRNLYTLAIGDTAR